MQLLPSKQISKRSGVCLITGDAWTLPADLKAFETIYAGVPHETFCVNRSVTAPGIKDCQHWGVADAEESVWFSGYLGRLFPEITRHTLKDHELDQHFDLSWSPNGMDVKEWKGGSGLMAIMIADALGYDSIMLAGMPMTSGAHWYGGEPVEWTQQALYTWEKYKNDKVKSMSGFTRFLFGGPNGI
jgi:hypothetical protein